MPPQKREALLVGVRGPLGACWLTLLAAENFYVQLCSSPILASANGRRMNCGDIVLNTTCIGAY
jgi:hypothetical protein